MSLKIVFDENVLIGASVGFDRDGKRFEDRNHRISSQLLDLTIESNDIEGWTFNSVDASVFYNLERHIFSGFLPKLENVDTKGKNGIYGTCSENLRNYIERINIIDVKPSEFEEYFEKVDKFYEELKHDFEEEFHGRNTSFSEIIKEKNISYDKANTIVNKIDNSYYRELHEKIKEKPASKDDRELLAKLAYLNEEVDEIDYFASNDRHFVSLRRQEPLPSDRYIPDKIEEEFNIVCDWPDKIYEEITSD